MAKGGARTRSGPAPDPTALARERDAGEWTKLPISGRTGPPPPWPLTDADARELDLWSDLWVKPQAIMWEKLGQQVEVALYVRRLAEAEQRGTAVNLSTLVRQMADSLGLTTPGMRAARWMIVRDMPGEKSSGSPGPVAAPRKSARDRLRVVGGDGVGGA